MPRIKEYMNQVGGPQDLPLAQVTRQAYASDFNGAGVGASMLGNSIEKGANDLTTAYRLQEEAKARQEVTDAAVELSRFHASAEHELRNAKTSGALDDDSYTEQFMARISTNLDSVGTKFQTAQGRQAWERGSAATQAHYLVAAGEAQSQMAGVKAVANFKDFVSNSSNAVMANPFNFEQTEQSVSSVIRDPKGVFGKLPAEKVDELALMAKQQLAQSAAQGVIRMDPSLGMELLTKGKYDSYLNPDAKHALITEARVGIAGQEAEARRQEAEAERQRKREIDEINQGMVEQYASRTLTVPTILESRLKATGDGSKEHWIKMLEAQNKETKEAPIKRDPGTFIDVLDGIRNGKVTSEQQIEQKFMDSAHLGVGITWEDTKQLRQELKDLRTPEGEKLGAQVKSFTEAFAPQIDKSNPVMGKIDFRGKAKLYEFNTMVMDKVNEYKQQGKDPRTLMDPKSPDFLGSPETINQYKTTMQDSIKEMSENMRRGQATKPPSAGTSPGVFQWFKDKFKPADEPQMLDPDGPPVPKGQIEPGNIDLSKRKAVENKDGSFSTVKSLSFEENGVHILVPSLDPSGKQMSDKQSWERYKDTGEHLGKFNTEAEATAAAKRISKGQEALDPKRAYKKGDQTHQQAVASLERAVKTMPGQEPVMVEPRKHGESAADFLKRWNEAHKK